MTSSALVEKLIQTVARAFYPDNVVIIFDALIREKFIREEEIGPRLKLSNKEIRKILCQLQEEMLIKSEDVTMIRDHNPSDGSVSTSMGKCWYIDYYLFTLVIRYRIYSIQNEIKQSMKLELNYLLFQCPSCHEKYNELQIQRLRSKDYKFLCSHCCPSNDIMNTMSQPYFTLVELNTTKQLSTKQTLEKKLLTQWTQSEHHDGIFDILAELRNEHIIRNLPSDNMKRGLITSRVTDDDVMLRIAENTSSTGGRKRKITTDMMNGGVGVGFGVGFSVEVADGDINSLNNSSTTDNGNNEMLVPQRQKALPSFLQGSRIVTTTTPSSTTSAISNEGNDGTQLTIGGKGEDGEGGGVEEEDEDDEWED